MGYQIIIADDEEKIVRLIQHLGHWEALGIEIVDVCANGLDAYDSIRRHRPDIVLTDIKMPGYDGLKLIEMTKALGYDTNFIVVSGYKHFDYARSAIQLGVVDYLLKPLDETHLNETLERTCRRIDVTRAQSSDLQALEQYVRSDAQRRQEGLWRTMFSGRSETGIVSLADLDTLNRTYGTHFTQSCFVAVSIATDLDGLLSEQASLFGEKVQQGIRATFDSRFEYLYYGQGGGQYLLLNPPAEECVRVKWYLERVYAYLRTMQEIYGDFTLYIGYSSVKETPADLPAALREAHAACYGRFLYPNQQVFSYTACARYPRFAPEEILPPEDISNLKNFLKYYQFEELGKLFSVIAQRASTYNRSNPLDILDALELLEHTVLPYISQPGESDAIRTEFQHNSISALSFEEVVRRFYLRLDELVARNYEQAQKKHGKPVEDAKRYIEQNYTRQISLDEVADQVGLSSAYFSKLFKSELNTGYAEYLTEVRLEHAKRLLLETNDSVKEISAQVGYLDDKYFSKLFKKQIGIKPSEFRKLYTG